MGADTRGAVIDQYADKLRNSGYSREQTRRILINGIKNYETRRRSRIEKYGKMRSTAKMSKGARSRKKLLGKSNWFRKRSSKLRYTKEQESWKGEEGGATPRADICSVL